MIESISQTNVTSTADAGVLTSQPPAVGQVLPFAVPGAQPKSFFAMLQELQTSAETSPEMLESLQSLSDLVDPSLLSEFAGEGEEANLTALMTDDGVLSESMLAEGTVPDEEALQSVISNLIAARAENRQVVQASDERSVNRVDGQVASLDLSTNAESIPSTMSERLAHMNSSEIASRQPQFAKKELVSEMPDTMDAIAAMSIEELEVAEVNTPAENLLADEEALTQTLTVSQNINVEDVDAPVAQELTAQTIQSDVQETATVAAVDGRESVVRDNSNGRQAGIGSTQSGMQTSWGTPAGNANGASSGGQMGQGGEQGQGAQQQSQQQTNVAGMNMQNINPVAREAQANQAQNFAHVMANASAEDAEAVTEGLDAPDSLGVASSERKATLPASMQSIPVPVKHPQWGQAMGQRVTYMVNANIQQAQITLNPEKLGPIQVKLSFDRDQQVQVNMVAQQGTTREALEQAIPRLREMLEQNGIALGEVNIENGESFSSELAQQDSNDSDGSADSSASSGSEEDMVDVETLQTVSTDNVVDFYA